MRPTSVIPRALSFSICERPIAALAGDVEDSQGVNLVPAFRGRGAPHWDETARGMICGMTRGTTGAHVASAVIESIAYQVRDVFDAMQADVGVPLQALLADGGATRNNDLMQFLADILNCTGPAQFVARGVTARRRIPGGIGDGHVVES